MSDRKETLADSKDILSVRDRILSAFSLDAYEMEPVWHFVNNAVNNAYLGSAPEEESILIQIDDILRKKGGLSLEEQKTIACRLHHLYKNNDLQALKGIKCLVEELKTMSPDPFPEGELNTLDFEALGREFRGYFPFINDDFIANMMHYISNLLAIAVGFQSEKRPITFRELPALKMFLDSIVFLRENRLSAIMQIYIVFTLDVFYLIQSITVKDGMEKLYSLLKGFHNPQFGDIGSITSSTEIAIKMAASG